MRIGHGYDVHRLVKGRRLVLGGVEIDYEKGLQGHSDADVLLHAIMDALLGAKGLGDIGTHFPDTDSRYKDISSIKLLSEVGGKVGQIINIDATVIAQAPRLSPYRDMCKKNIAEALGISEEKVNIKFTTEEGLGFTGAGEGMAAWAVCLIE